MKKLIVSLIVGFFLGMALLGCSGEQIRAFRLQLEGKEKALAEMRTEVDHLKKTAAETHDERLAAAADAADKALVEAEKALPAMREQLKSMESNGGTILSAIGGFALTYILPQLVGMIPLVGKPAQELLANAHWKVAATKDQKSADAP